MSYLVFQHPCVYLLFPCLPIYLTIYFYPLSHLTNDWSELIFTLFSLRDPMDYTVQGILQTRILEWVAFPFSRGSFQPRNQTQVSRIAGGFFTSWATREALKAGNMSSIPGWGTKVPQVSAKKKKKTKYSFKWPGVPWIHGTLLTIF